MDGFCLSTQQHSEAIIKSFLKTNIEKATFCPYLLELVTEVWKRWMMDGWVSETNYCQQDKMCKAARRHRWYVVSYYVYVAHRDHWSSWWAYTCVSVLQLVWDQWFSVRTAWLETNIWNIVHLYCKHARHPVSHALCRTFYCKEENGLVCSFCYANAGDLHPNSSLLLMVIAWQAQLMFFFS